MKENSIKQAEYHIFPFLSSFAKPYEKQRYLNPHREIVCHWTDLKNIYILDFYQNMWNDLNLR